MTPVVLTFSDGEQLRVFVRSMEIFQAAVDQEECILSNAQEVSGDVPEGLVECSLTMLDGTRMVCMLPESEVLTVVENCHNIVYCEKSFIAETATLRAKELELDQRLMATYAVIQNLPNKTKQMNLYRDYLKRKSAYVASMEALIEGALK